MSDVDWVAEAIKLGRDPHALVATQCDECGMLVVCSTAKSVEHSITRPKSADSQHGHHVHPDDPDNDWICYGHPVEIDHPVAIQAFETRSAFGVADVQLSKTDRLILGEMSRDDRKTTIASGTIKRVTADTSAAVASIDDQIAKLQALRAQVVTK